tara:strand:+ start:11510 stop:11683 length:174 start_codon:yes stop_codon:yes gene_type:complete
MSMYYEDLDPDTVTIEELLIAIGSVMFAGSKLSDIDTSLLYRLQSLLKDELNGRTVH